MNTNKRSKLKTCLRWVGGIALGCVAVVGGAYLAYQVNPDLFKNVIPTGTNAGLPVSESANARYALPTVKPTMDVVDQSIVHSYRGPLDKTALSETIVDIAAYKRTLPSGQVASDTARQLAKRMDVQLAANETMVNSFSRTQWRTNKGA